MRFMCVFRHLLAVILMVLVLPVSAQDAVQPKALGAVTQETVVRAGVSFDPAQSRGVFIGVNNYTAPGGVRPPNLKSCVNDAVDLAAAFMDLGLIEGPGVTVALSGEPSKAESVENLARLREAGSVIAPDARRDTIDFLISKAASEAGADGILFLTWSAHGFETGGIQYLTPENFYSMTDRPSVGEIAGRAISEGTLAAVAESSPAHRRVLLFDACRETKAMGVGVPELIGSAAGSVTLYAVTTGELALDGSRNGAFTEKVLAALTGPPPDALKSDRNGHITVGTLLDYLGTAGKIEDPKIHRMPLREDPREAGKAEARDVALGCFREAKQVDIAATRDERMLDGISLGAFEDALFTASGPMLTREAIALLDTPEKRADHRNRRSFAAAWTQSMPAVTEPPQTVQPTVRPTPASLGIDELLALQDQAKAEWEKLQKLDALENVKANDKARFYTAYITNFEQANYMLAEARHRQRYWTEWKPPTPSPQPSPTPEDQWSDDGRYIKAYTGVITDTLTNLQWVVGPDRDIHYDEAAAWVRECTLDGGGWRMPTVMELRALYVDHASTYNIEGMFGFSGWRWVWAGDSSMAWSSFVNGGESFPYRNPPRDGRVLGVRASNDVNVKERLSVDSQSTLSGPTPMTSVPSISRPGTNPGDRAELTLSGGVRMAFRWCPPGSFTMGSPSDEADRRSDENQVQVRLSQGFWMAETEVTQAQYRAVMGTNPANFKGDSLPVEQVSWNDAAEFCRKLSSSFGLTVLLPTEAQWEYACRAGTTTPFHFGRTITPEQANYNAKHSYGGAATGENRGKTTPVASLTANSWGLTDMHGNVAEWCADWYGSSLAGGADPTGASSGDYRVIRGGSWLHYPMVCRSASRLNDRPSVRSGIGGFRPVLMAQ